jgi:hypothetical protein
MTGTTDSSKPSLRMNAAHDSPDTTGPRAPASSRTTVFTRWSPCSTSGGGLSSPDTRATPSPSPPLPRDEPDEAPGQADDIHKRDRRCCSAADQGSCALNAPSSTQNWRKLCLPTATSLIEDTSSLSSGSQRFIVLKLCVGAAQLKDVEVGSPARTGNNLEALFLEPGLDRPTTSSSHAL